MNNLVHGWLYKINLQPIGITITKTSMKSIEWKAVLHVPKKKGFVQLLVHIVACSCISAIGLKK